MSNANPTRGPKLCFLRSPCWPFAVTPDLAQRRQDSAGTVTQTEVQRQARRNTPVVLNEKVEIRGLHRQTEGPDALGENASVALARPDSCGRGGSS